MVHVQHGRAEWPRRCVCNQVATPVHGENGPRGEAIEQDEGGGS